MSEPRKCSLLSRLFEAIDEERKKNLYFLTSAHYHNVMYDDTLYYTQVKEPLYDTLYYTQVKEPVYVIIISV